MAAATLTRDAFEKYLHQFFVVADSPDVKLELIEAKTLTTGGQDGGREPFSLLFRGPEEPLLSQGTFQLGSTDLGDLDIFLVPVGPDQKGMRYEAIFS